MSFLVRSPLIICCVVLRSSLLLTLRSSMLFQVCLFVSLFWMPMWWFFLPLWFCLLMIVGNKVFLCFCMICVSCLWICLGVRRCSSGTWMLNRFWFSRSSLSLRMMMLTLFFPWRYSKLKKACPFGFCVVSPMCAYLCFSSLLFLSSL